MKILVVCSYKPQLPEGVAPFVREQVEALSAQGCKCTYYHIKGKSVLGYLREVPKLRRMIREWKPDIVHAHFGLSCLVANLATRHVPIVSTYHGSDINVAPIRMLSAIAIWMSAWNIFVSKRNVDIVKPRGHWSLIPCGINIPKPWHELRTQLVEQLTLNQWVETVLSKGKKHVLFAGAFDNAVKDPILAKQVVNELKKEGMNVELIELKGYSRNQVNALMYNCDAFLMTSKTEGSPQVIKEAMACGCPIVSVDVGDVEERIDGVDGCYIVPSRDPREIADALKKALLFKGRTTGLDRIIEMGLTNEQVAKRIIEIYEKVIRK